MKRIVIIILALIMTVSVVYAQDYNKGHTPFKVDMNFAINPPAVGTNDFFITISDSMGKLITDADIAVNYFMEGQRSSAKECKIIAPHCGESVAELEKTAYKSQVDFSMPGRWTIRVEVKFGVVKEVTQYDILVK
jgi:hypothetical protein